MIDNLALLLELLFLLVFSFSDKLLKFALELLHVLQLRVVVLLDFDNLTFEEFFLGDFLGLDLSGWLGVSEVDKVVLFGVFLREGVLDVEGVGRLFFGGPGG